MLLCVNELCYVLFDPTKVGKFKQLKNLQFSSVQFSLECTHAYLFVSSLLNVTIPRATVDVFFYSIKSCGRLSL